jgi:tetratricopeptide (TPR) repeat protein
VVALVGEPGVGKSPLVEECLHSSRTQGWVVWESRAPSYGQATPYLPVIDLLKAYCGIDARDDPQRMREKIVGTGLGLDEALRSILPPILALLEVPVDDADWPGLDPPQRRQRTLEAIKRVLLRESRVQPLLLVFEDLHWIDGETQAVLDSLVESLPTARILLLVNYRPEYQHSWGAKTYYTQLRLDPLPPASADELLQALLGNDPSLAPLKTLLIVQTEGNPFFLKESVRTLIETQMLVGEPGDYRLTQPMQTLHIPATVQTVLAARIDRLPAEEKRVLQTAAVIGTEVHFALLQAVAESPKDVLHRGVTHLQAAEFLYETRLFPEHEYTFRHALTQQVAYGTLLQERRRALYARIVAALEALPEDRVAEQVERLAHHAPRGEVWDKAVAYCRQAGEKAMERSAYYEAVGYFCFRETVAALKGVRRRERFSQINLPAVFCRANLAWCHAELGMFAEGRAFGDEGLRIAEAVAHLGSMIFASWGLGLLSLRQGDVPRALPVLERAVGLCHDADRLVWFPETAAALGAAYTLDGRVADAVALPFPEATFDVVLCQQGLPCFPDRPAALHEMHRVLAPGGRLALSVYRAIAHHPATQALADTLARHGAPQAAAIKRAEHAGSPCGGGIPLSPSADATTVEVMHPGQTGDKSGVVVGGVAALVRARESPDQAALGSMRGHGAWPTSRA